MSPDPRSRARNRSLDALRGLAAMSVVLHHYGFSYEGRIGPHNAAVPLFTGGHFGVELFFILSGFVIAGTLERTPTLGRFVLHRAARLYPAFLVCAGLTLAVFALGGPNPVSVSPLSALVGLTMLAPLVQVPPIDPSHWTLAYEVAFYALAGLCLRRDPERACAAWLAAALLGTLVLPVEGVRVLVLLNLPFALLFVIGAMLSRLVDHRLGPLGLGTLATALGLTTLGPAINHAGLGAIGYVPLVLAFAGAVWAAATGRLTWLDRTPLVFLGTISYPLYLVHQILGYAIIQALEAAGWPAGTAIAAALLAVVVLAALIRVTVEVPAQRAIRWAWAGRAGADGRHVAFASRGLGGRGEPSSDSIGLGGR